MLQRPFAIRLGRSSAAAVLLLAVAAPTVGAGSAPLLDGWRPAPTTTPVVVRVSALRYADTSRPGQRARAAAGTLGVVTPAASDPCADRKRTFTGGRWQEPYRWSFRARTTPTGLTRTATAKALKRAVTNITRADNDCGRPDRVSATAIFLGSGPRQPGPTERGTCAPRDGYNAVGFGKLPSGIAGLTCIWSIGDRIVEADIKLDRNARWATSIGSCRLAALVEAVATHEFGHAFGLGHVSEARHGRLTMSERLDGYCQNGESTLGLGDLLGLEQLY